jgi:prenyltransferase beta subunit
VSQSPYIPYYQQMINLLSKAIALLDVEGRSEVLHFITDEQNADGGFKDRAGRSDLYYSLFGMMILKAMEKAGNEEKGEGKQEKEKIGNEEQGIRNKEGRRIDLMSNSIYKLNEFIKSKSSGKVPGFIERCCLVLLQKAMKSSRSSRLKSLLSLGKSFWKERTSINMSYRSFVLFLTLDSIMPVTGIIRKSVRRILAHTTLDEHSPCSEIAAKVFMRRLMNQKDSMEEELLASYTCKSGGFKAFMHLYHADMLSTAVALYSLNFAGADLRILKPSCLEFIESNYSNGAFLSGDGDSTADVEYTFYGLLALGVLVN